MEPRAHHVLIGFFTVIASIGAILFALWLGGMGQSKSDRYYTVLFDEAVQGLSVGSAVQYNGIKVGEVSSLTIDPKDMRRVRARIKLPEDIPIHMDTRARLVLMGITGASIIGLSGGSPDSPLITGQTRAQEDLSEPTEGVNVLLAEPSPLSQLLAGGDNLMTNLTELVANAKRFFSSRNARNISHILENVDDLTEDLAQQTLDLHEVLLTLKEAGEQAQAMMASVSGLAQRADGLLADQGQTAMQALQDAMLAFQRTSTSLEDAIGDNASSLSSGIQGLQEIGPALGQMRRTLATMEAVMQRLNDNPSGYLLGGETLMEYEP